MTRRSKRRKIEPAEVQVKSEQRKPKLKTKAKRKLPRGKKVKEEVVEEDNAFEDLESATAQSTGSPLEVVHIAEDLSQELEALRKQLREKDEVSNVSRDGIGHGSSRP